jgi:lipopolysaccharide export LptBFGC system permease protein LptF
VPVYVMVEPEMLALTASSLSGAPTSTLVLSVVIIAIILSCVCCCVSQTIACQHCCKKCVSVF